MNPMGYCLGNRPLLLEKWVPSYYSETIKGLDLNQPITYIVVTNTYNLTFSDRFDR